MYDVIISSYLEAGKLIFLSVYPWYEVLGQLIVIQPDKKFNSVVIQPVKKFQLTVIQPVKIFHFIVNTSTYILPSQCNFYFCLLYMSYLEAVPSLASHRGGPGSRPGSMWGLWWTKWHWDRLSPSTSVSPANYSTNSSIIIITRVWHNRPISGRSAEWIQLDSTPHYTNLKKMSYLTTATCFCRIQPSSGKCFLTTVVLQHAKLQNAVLI
jgi:hypothetical protein